MNSIEIILTLCFFVIAFIILWRFYTKQGVQTASGEFLSRWGNMCATPRTFYGSGSTKPYADCFWDKDGIPPGWYETDANLRKRIINKINGRG